jgi:hypothetical protein
MAKILDINYFKEQHKNKIRNKPFFEKTINKKESISNIENNNKNIIFQNEDDQISEQEWWNNYVKRRRTQNNTSNRELYSFCQETGKKIINFSELSNSDIESLTKSDQNLYRTFFSSHSKSESFKNILTGSWGGIPISKHAKSKLELIVEKFCELTNQLPNEYDSSIISSDNNYEFGVYLMSKKDHLDSGFLNSKYLVIDDIFLPPEQIVTKSHCDILGDAFDYITPYRIANNSKIAGWGHSHGSYNSFFSTEDISSFENMFNTHATIEKIKGRENNEYKLFDAKYLFAIVVNSKKEYFIKAKLELPEFDPISDEYLGQRTYDFDDINLRELDDDFFIANYNEYETTNLLGGIQLNPQRKKLNEYSQIQHHFDPDFKRESYPEVMELYKKQKIEKIKQFATKNKVA